MASVKKYKLKEVPSQIRHVERSSQFFMNSKIELDRIGEDYILTPDRGIDSYAFFCDRVKKMHYLKRKDVIMMIGWVVTCPTDLPLNKQFDFFSLVYRFFSEKYGESNIVTAVVHKDEDRPHIHALIIPAVKDTDISHEQDERILCKVVINRKTLAEFHPELQRFLDQNGLNVSINGGIKHKRPIQNEISGFYLSKG